jgi:hypothetical protein
MRPVKNARKETILPQVANPLPIPVHLQGVLGVGSPQGASQRLSGRRNRDQVNVVGHQAPSQYPELVVSGVFGKYLQISPAIVAGEENVFPVVASLGDVMGEAGSYESRSAWH